MKKQMILSEIQSRAMAKPKIVDCHDNELTRVFARVLIFLMNGRGANDEQAALYHELLAEARKIPGWEDPPFVL